MPSSFEFLGQCMETAGFLFSRPCSRDAVEQCTYCQKAICMAHARPRETGTLCTSCARLMPVSPGDGSSMDDPSYYYDSYGYYGSSSWGHGSSRDPHDFTEADGESLRQEDDASFEEDMGGS
ncbi:hypothetical protein JGU66_29815 [Myxococcaceae bacterium JPH2]|nr:hypothetical protein [Myxococcaceae bacterium JPH2]